MLATVDRVGRVNRELATNESQTVTKTTTYSMSVTDRLVLASTAAGAWTLTLPQVSRCAGNMYSIKLTAGAGAGAAPNALTITNRGDSKRWYGNILLRRPGQSVILLSDGEEWHPVRASSGVPLPRAKGFHEMFELPFVNANVLTGGTPAAAGKNMIVCGSGLALTYNNIVGQTLLGPAWSDPGMNVAGDQTDNDGMEVSVPLGANTPHRFVVGTDEAFFCRVRMSIADVSGTDDLLVGFRKLEAYQAAVDDYADMAALNVISGAINIETIDKGAATTTTDTTNTWADTATHTLAVYVTKAGVVTYQIDDAAPAVTAAFSFDAGDVVIPFIYALQASDLSGNIIILEWECGYQV